MAHCAISRILSKRAQWYWKSEILFNRFNEIKRISQISLLIIFEIYSTILTNYINLWNFIMVLDNCYRSKHFLNNYVKYFNTSKQKIKYSILFKKEKMTQSLSDLFYNYVRMVIDNIDEIRLIEKKYKKN